MKATLIKKENLTYYNFPLEDVLPKMHDKVERKRELQKAMVLGNGFKHKVKIDFFTKGRPYPVSVETTVWSVDDDFVFLKGGRTIPVKSIKSIQL